MKFFLTAFLFVAPFLVLAKEPVAIDATKLKHPAKPALWKIEGKGHIAVGRDGDLTLVDLKRTEIVQDDWIGSRVGWTPFAGMPLTGWPVATFIRGHHVMQEAELLGDPIGEAYRFGRPD